MLSSTEKAGKISPFASFKCPQPSQGISPYQVDSPEFNRYRRRTWVWVVALMDIIIAVLICGRFFYYVAKDARISNTPPNSELEDRISLLWTWFAFLAAYVCQILFGIGLIIGTRKVYHFEAASESDRETVLGNCQLWIYGAHLLNLYTFIELLIVFYYIFSVKNVLRSTSVLVAVLAIIKIVFRISAFVVVKLFMADLGRQSCSCPASQHQPQHQQQMHQPQPPQYPQGQPQMMAMPPNSQYHSALYQIQQP